MQFARREHKSGKYFTVSGSEVRPLGSAAHIVQALCSKWTDWRQLTVRTGTVCVSSTAGLPSLPPPPPPPPLNPVQSSSTPKPTLNALFYRLRLVSHQSSVNPAGALASSSVTWCIKTPLAGDEQQDAPDLPSVQYTQSLFYVTNVVRHILSARFYTY